MLVAHAEERGLQHVEVAVVDHLLEELHEVGDHQVADVHPVHIGVGGEDDFLVAQPVEVVLNVEGAHQVVELVVLVNDVALEIPHVERLALEGEDRLRVHVAAARDGAGGGLALADEDHRAAALVLLPVEVDLAVLELRDAQRDGLGPLTGKLLHVLQLFAKLLRVLDLPHDLLRDGFVAVEEMEQLLAHLVDQLGADLRVAQLVLRLRLEERVLHADGHRADHALAHVVAVVALLRVFVHRLEQALAEGAQVRAAVAGVLAVDEGVETLAVAAVGVREAELQRLAREVQRRVNRLRVVRLQILHDQVVQAVARDELGAVVNQPQTAVQVAVVAQPTLDELRLELALLEDDRVRLELDERAVGLLGLALVLLLELALLEGRLGELTVTMAPHRKLLRQRVDGLGADAVKADAELEDLAVVFRARVDLGNAVHELAQRDATPEVAHADVVALDSDFHLLAEAHDELVNRVINDLLEQDVAAVIVVRAAADAPDIHPRAQADVVDAGERLDLALVVIVLRGFFVSHVSRG